MLQRASNTAKVILLTYYHLGQLQIFAECQMRAIKACISASMGRLPSMPAKMQLPIASFERLQEHFRRFVTSDKPV